MQAQPWKLRMAPGKWWLENVGRRLSFWDWKAFNLFYFWGVLHVTTSGVYCMPARSWGSARGTNKGTLLRSSWMIQWISEAQLNGNYQYLPKDLLYVDKHWDTAVVTIWDNWMRVLIHNVLLYNHILTIYIHTTKTHCSLLYMSSITQKDETETWCKKDKIRSTKMSVSIPGSTPAFPLMSAGASNKGPTSLRSSPTPERAIQKPAVVQFPCIQQKSWEFPNSSPHS